MRDLRGIYPALPTPMAADGTINYACLRDLVDFEIAQGIDGSTSVDLPLSRSSSLRKNA